MLSLPAVPSTDIINLKPNALFNTLYCLFLMKYFDLIYLKLNPDEAFCSLYFVSNLYHIIKKIKMFSAYSNKRLL